MNMDFRQNLEEALRYAKDYSEELTNKAVEICLESIIEGMNEEYLFMTRITDVLTLELSVKKDLTEESVIVVEFCSYSYDSDYSETKYIPLAIKINFYDAENNLVQFSSDELVEILKALKEEFSEMNFLCAWDKDSDIEKLMVVVPYELMP